MRKITVFLILCASASQSLAQVSDPRIVEINKKNRWVYETLRFLRQTIFSKLTNIGPGARPMSRYECALSTHNLWQQLQDNETRLEKDISAVRTDLIGSTASSILSGKQASKSSALKELIQLKENYLSCYLRLPKMYEEFKPELKYVFENRDLEHFGQMLNIRYAEVQNSRKYSKNNLSFVDPKRLKSNNCAPSVVSQFNSLLITADKSLGTPENLKLTTRIEYALTTYQIHNKILGKLGKPEHTALTKLVNEFRPELVYYLGVNIYQMKRELAAKQ